MVDPDLLFGTIVAIFLVVISAITLFHWWTPMKYDYWKKNGVPFVDPSLRANNEKPFNEILVERYHQLGPIYGYFEGKKPKISIGDPALLKNILIKDFSFFMGRKPVVTGDEVHDKMLTIARGEDWKRIRSIVSPIFTTGKLKKMLHIFKDCCQVLMKSLKSAAEEGKSVDLKSVYGAFTIDVIAGAIFSAKVDSHNDPGNQFVKTARDVFGGKPGKRPTTFPGVVSPKFSRILICQCNRWCNFLRQGLLARHPGNQFVKTTRDVFGGKPGKRPTAIPLLSRLLKLFKTDHASSSRTEIFRKITHQVVEERRKTGQARNDFLQLLMDSAKENSEEEKSDWAQKEETCIDSNCDEQTDGHQPPKTSSKKLSMDELVGQCLIFFLAGYETTSSTLSFVTHLLAHHQDAQDKLREEVAEVLAETNGELTYEAVQNMKYLDNVISETLRLYPPAIQLERYADADYKLEDKGITIPKGMGVTIPIYAVHRDSKFFLHPERFDPDRFTPEAKSMRDPYTYMPFGAGPRNCVGMRFAFLETKICLSYVVTNFRIKTTPHTKEELEFHPGASGFLRPKEVLVEMEIREDSFEIK
ncbi:Cytochrome P450 3A21 [Araneus ventricosus]|uniref:Cytochrome P450 3A21 n=1 Tax=Araneus ventricosus TaxID=182803 RepID=A0A4Y2G970_ARAVE|nr:Cytochrome P450 3A21 [Araneus ventricosus]